MSRLSFFQQSTDMTANSFLRKEEAVVKDLVSTFWTLSLDEASYLGDNRRDPILLAELILTGHGMQEVLASI